MDEEEFEKCFNYFKFKENKNDPFSVAEVKRKCLALNFFGSINLNQENEVTEYLLRKDLECYSEIVDDQGPNGVNNYSESVLACLPPSQYENRKTWRTGLDTVQLEDFVKPPPCISNGKSCNNMRFEKRWIKLLKKAVSENGTQDNAHFEKICPEPNQIYSNMALEIKPTNMKLKEKEPCSTDKDYQSEDTGKKWKNISFRTAREELQIQNMKKNRNNSPGTSNDGNWSYAPVKKSLGTRKGGGVFNKFQPPIRSTNEKQIEQTKESPQAEEEIDERLKNIDPKMIELIKSEIMDCGTKISWDDIAGLELAKSTIQEIVVWPMLRPDIFTGLRRPPKGILLFGPPGTGKTLIGKCIASQSCSTFFSISASSLTSKWIGDGEKMVRALFAVARCHQPAVVFIDEIDSLLSQRSDSEHESSRRLKTEFLVQLDGAGTEEEDRILIIGATNRPQELDEAARRRLVKRLYIPLPDEKAREQIIHNLILKERHCLTKEEIHEISVLCRGYSGADMKNLCQEASLGPIRSIPPMDIKRINPEDVRPLNASDFRSALNRIKSSVSEKDLDIYITWDKQYGCGGSHQ